MDEGFSPRNGEVILKLVKARAVVKEAGFSPRNGEVILKHTIKLITKQG